MEMNSNTCEIKLTITDIRELSALLKGIESTELNVSNETFWFSWVWFDKPFQTREFLLSDVITEEGLTQSSTVSTETIPIFHFNEQASTTYEYQYRPQSMINVIPKEVTAQFPLKIFLCSAGQILAYCILHADSLVENHFPICSDQWLPFQVIVPGSRPDASRGTKLGVSLSIIRYEPEEHAREADKEEKEEEEEEANYSDEEFEEDGPKLPPPPAPVPVPPLMISSPMEQHDDVMTSPSHQSLRHFRLSLEIKSVRGLNRPAHLFLQVTYGHLGVNTVVRTPPQWHRANVETLIEKGAVSYECATTRARLHEIFMQHPLKIFIFERSQLGNKAIGSVSIDLSAIESLPVHGYKCPVTGRHFQVLSDYNDHRNNLSVMYHNGDINRLPPNDPETLRALDTYVNIDIIDDEEEEMKGKGIGLAATLAKAKIRLLIVLEDKGVVGREMATRIKKGYRMHNGAVYGLGNYEDEEQDIGGTDGEKDKQDVDGVRNLEVGDQSRFLSPVAGPGTTTGSMNNQHIIDWELWRQQQEREWRNSLHDREIALRSQIKEEAAKMMEGKVDDLRRAQVEVGKLEVRLKAAIEATERQRTKLIQQEEYLQSRVNQKLQELQLLSKRVKAEAKTVIDAEQQKTGAMEAQMRALQDSLRVAERRALSAEKDFESLKAQMRNSSETLLREELSITKAQLAECRETVEKEKNLRSGVILEREHFRAQMHRLAAALKREREKTAIMARQELEQLRLEFLAREER
jgi:hypothetical protein